MADTHTIQVEAAVFEKTNGKYITSCTANITNTNNRRIGWAIDTENMKLLGVDPLCGVLEPNEVVSLKIWPDRNNSLRVDKKEEIQIKWVYASDGAGKQFSDEWFKRDLPIYRKDMPIEYR